MCWLVPSRIRYQASASLEGGGAVEAGAEPVEQGPVPQRDVGQVPRGGADSGQARPVAGVGAL